MMETHKKYTKRNSDCAGPGVELITSPATKKTYYCTGIKPQFDAWQRSWYHCSFKTKIIEIIFYFILTQVFFILSISTYQ